MNYERIYTEIIDRSKNRDIKGYAEKHHIVPKSMGGTNGKDNIAVLTAREHFICHWLLYKIHKNDKMAFAWNMMSLTTSKLHEGRTRQTSKKYEYARKAFSKHIGSIHKGKTLSDEHKQKLSESKMGELNPMYGKSHSDEHKQYLSEINSGELNGFYGKTHTEETKKKVSEARKKYVGELHPNFGRTDMISEETKKKFSDMYKGKPRSKPHEIVKCPHCDKEGIKPNMKRWHFDNCKTLK